MDAFQAVADPVRRRLIETLADGERQAGELVEVARDEFGVGQSGTSKHLRALRESAVVTSHVDGARRIYRLRPEAVAEIGAWAQRQTRFWTDRLDALQHEFDKEDDR